MTHFLSKFLYLTKGHHKDLLGIASLFLLISTLEIMGTGLVGPFIAIATSPGSIQRNSWLRLVYQKFHFSSEHEFLVILGLLVMAAFYIKAFLSFNAQKTVFEFGYSLKGEMSYNLLKAYLSAPYTFHLGRNSASLIQSMITSTDQFCIGLVMSLLTSVSNAIVIVALVLLLVWTNAMASIIVAVVLLASFALLYPLKDRLARWGRQGYDASAEMIRIMNHGLGGLKETRVIGCESYFEQQMEKQAKIYSKSTSFAISYSNLPRYVIEAFLISFLIGFTFLFITFNRGDEQSLSSVLGIFALASIRLLPAAGNLISGINVVRYNAHALDRLSLDFKELEKAQLSTGLETIYPPTTSAGHKQKILCLTNTLVLDGLVYHYPNAERNALRGISLNIEKGQSIGLIGKSGSGKTTLVDVLLGLLIPQEGDIRVDGISVYTDIRSWQNTIGYVPQSIFLIDDTMRQNIAFGVPDHLIDLDRLNRAVVAAQLSEVIEKLPEGLDTVVGERGVLLSGGQRQRVGIARALYHEREILVFDEATAALDNETESLVTEATKSLSGIKTIIIIAHRLTTVEHCDRIYQLDQGRILKSGSYQEVVLGQ